MNERLKELARQAKPNPNLIWEDADLERFAELVRDDERDKLQKPYLVIVDAIRLDEREACAKLCDNIDTPDGWSTSSLSASIRARGNYERTHKKNS